MGLLLLQGSSDLNPRELFANGEQGLWLDPSDMSTLYQDSNGVTPCTAAGDPVGLILDQSRGGLGALGPELVTNGDFASGQTGWIDSPVAPSGWSFTGGALVGSNAAGGYEQAVQVTSGKWYRCTITLSNVSGGAVSFAVAGAGAGPTFSSNGTNTVLINAGSTGNIGIVRRTSNFTGTIDNISIREVPGNHAYQTTSASRPTLARIPSSGRRNLLTRTEEFDNAAWTKLGGSISANQITDPLAGQQTVDLFTEDSGTSNHGCSISYTATAGANTFSMYVKYDSHPFFELVLDTSDGNSVSTFNLTNGTVNSNGTGATGAISALVNGWYRCAVTYTLTAGAKTARFRCGTDSVTYFYAGNGTRKTYIWGAQLETGSTATNYQKVVATTDVTESGVSDLWHLVFDGSDDSLVTNSISFDTWTQETRRNLLVDTESLSTGNWISNGGTVTENTTVAPDGTTTADTLTRSTAATEGRYQAVAFTGDGAKAVSVYVKAGTAPSLGVWLFDSTATVNRMLAAVDMTGATPIVTLTAGASSAVENVGSGWFRLTFVSTSVTAANTNRLYLMPAYGGASANGQTSIFWGVQAENATASTTYQRVGTDEMTVIAGVRKLSDAARGTVCELTATIASNNGAFHLTAPNAASDTFAFESKGTALTDAVATGIASPASRVLAGLADISGDSAILRINGTQSDADTGDQGTGNYSNAAIYIGRRGSSSLPFNGHIYQLIIRGKTTPTGKLLEAERFVGRKTGVTGI